MVPDPDLRGAAWWGRALACGVLVGVVAAWLRWSLPTSPQVLWDEFWYLSTAHHITVVRDATPLLEQGLPPQAPPGDEFRPPYPQGWPWLEALTYRADAPYAGAVQLQRVVGVLACLAYFAMLAADSLPAALFAGLGLALLPAYLRLSQGASSEGASALFVLLALWSARSQRFRPGTAGALLALFACAWAVHFRPENFLYLLLFLPHAFVGAKSGAPRGWLIAGLLLFLCFAGADFAIMTEARSASNFQAIPRHGFATRFDNTLANLGNNVLFLVDGRVLPRWVTLMAVVGTVLVWRAGFVRPPLFYWGWVVLFTLALSTYPFGDFAARNSADTWRFSVQVTLPLLLLGARAVEWALRGLLPMARAIFVLLVGTVMAASAWSWQGFVTAPHPAALVWADLHEVAARTPTGAVVVLNDSSYAVALREGLGVRTTLASSPKNLVDDSTTTAPPLTTHQIQAYRGPLCLLQIGQDPLPSAWDTVPTTVLWTLVTQAGEPREAFTLYERR